MTLKVDIEIRPSPVQTHRPDGIFAQALHDFDTRAYYRDAWGVSVPRSLVSDNDKLDNDKGFAEMVPFSPRIGVKLTKDLQWFWFRQILISKYGHNEMYRLSPLERDYILNAWRGLTGGHTAFLNGAGTDTRRDYITGVNPDADLPILWENTCGGSVLELFSVEENRGRYSVKTLDPARYDLWKHWTFRSHPQYFSMGTNSTPLGYDRRWTKAGPWRVDPFHYLDGLDVPVPIMSAGGHAAVHADRVRILEADEPFPPRAYVP